MEDIHTYVEQATRLATKWHAAGICGTYAGFWEHVGY